MKTLESYLIPTQNELFAMLENKYGKYISAKSKKNYILVKGKAPILLVAHLDTVHKEPVKEICKTEDGNILMSPQGIGGDDRCGVYALTSIWEKSKVKPWLLFTCDEEIGGVGASKFAEDYANGCTRDMSDIKMIVEIDRKGEDDAVYYNCDNPEFEDYITGKGFVTDYGSYSDICEIAPAMGVAAVNLSSGYYNAHTTHEHINREHLENVIAKVITMVRDVCNNSFKSFEYIERKKVYSIYRYQWDKYYDDYWKDWTGLYYTEEDEDEDVRDYISNEILPGVPRDITLEYYALLSFYTEGELEGVRAELGDTGIIKLAQNEFRDNYDEVILDTFSEIEEMMTDQKKGWNKYVREGDIPGRRDNNRGNERLRI